MNEMTLLVFVTTTFIVLTIMLRYLD